MAEKQQNPLGEPEKDPKKEAEAATKYGGYGVESLPNALISSAETPQEVFYGLRMIEAKLESGDIPSSLSESYRPPGQLTVMYERAEALNITPPELERRGWLEAYDKFSGAGILKDRKFGSVAIKTTNAIVTNPDTKEQEVVTVYDLGTPKDRKELARAYERAVLELEARAILGEHIGARLHLNLRDSLEGLVDWQHGTTAKFKADHLQALFNMPDVEELANNPENRVLGDQVEEAMLLNLIMLNSGTKQKMQEFLDRPGVQHLISKLAKEEEARRGGEEQYTRVDWIEDNIGKVNNWVDDNNRELETWREEARDKRRGKLTQWSNIAAFAGNPGEFGGDDEKHFIENTIGGLVGSVEASWVAATMMRAIGAYASEGYVALPNGKSSLPLGEGRYISSDDTGKFYGYMFNYKEGTKGRSSGLKDMIGRIPDLAMNLFDWAQVRVVLPNGEQGRRSIWDAWLGTPGGKAKIDLLTGEETADRTDKEEYHRLGDLDLQSLDRDFHGTFGIMQWLAGREGAGVLTDALKVEKFSFEEHSLNELKKKIKYIGIVMNPIFLTKGSPHLYELKTESTEQLKSYDLTAEGAGKFEFHTVKSKNVETIQRRFFRNLMSARMKSAAFLMEIVPQSKKVLNLGQAGGDFLEIPCLKLIEMYTNEAARPNPKSEAELLEHYIDDIARLGSHVGWKDVPEVRERAARSLDSISGRIVGKVTGRKF